MARKVVLLVILFFVLGIDWDVASARTLTLRAGCA